MNDLLPNLSSSVFLSLPGFRLYALCVIVLILKMNATGIFTAMTRSRLKVALNAEDAARFGAQLTTTEHPDVDRVLRAHRNDLENIPSFFLLGLIAVMVGAPLLGMQITFIAFTAARVVHTVSYVKAMQPWRSMSFGIGSLANFALMVMIVIRLFA
jgi:prostaglandin-E synthase 1